MEVPDKSRSRPDTDLSGLGDGSPQRSLDRATIIGTIKTYLGFYVLAMLVIEAILGLILLQTAGATRVVLALCMLLVIVALVLVVSLFAYYRPEVLLRSSFPDVSHESEELRQFCEHIAGYWWQHIQPDQPSAVSFVDVRPDVPKNAIRMAGTAYDRQGNVEAIWETVATCINVGDRRAFYYWKGWHPARPGSPYEGVGEVSFRGSDQVIDRGFGFFSDTNVTDLTSTTKQSVVFKRSTAEESQIMRSGDDVRVTELVRNRLQTG